MSKRENERLEWSEVNERVQRQLRKETLNGERNKGEGNMLQGSKESCKERCYLFNHFILLRTLTVTI